LLLITLVGGSLRFYDLSVPPLWRDEAFTYWRVCGTYREMLDILRFDGFMPLHYELYFLISRHVPMTPTAMRFVPALAGTLTIPAIYWVARQLLTPRVALLAATMAAGSAFFMYYARDAKMYSHFWLCCTLSMGGLLWWLRTRSCTAWLSWIAASLAMLGLHALGLIVIGLQLLIFLTHRRAGLQPAMLLFVGIGIIVSGIGPYAAAFNRWQERIEQDGWQRSSGLAWIDAQISGDSSADLLEFALVQQVFTGNRREQRIDDPELSAGLRAVRWCAIGLPIAGLFPWPSRRRKRAPARERGWRTTLWLGAWIVVPVYAFYCISVPDFAWPGEAIRAVWHQWIWPWAIPLSIAAVAGFFCCSPSWRGRFAKVGQLLLVAAALWLLCVALAAAVEDRPRQPIWMTRYFSMMFPALLIAIAALLNRLPGPLAWLGVGLFIAANAPHFPSTWIDPKPGAPLAALARDVAAAQGDRSLRTYTLQPQSWRFAQHATFSTPESRYYLFRATGRQTTPRDFLTGDISAWCVVGANASMTRIARDVRNDRSIERVIVWEESSPSLHLAMQDMPLAGFALVSNSSVPFSPMSGAADSGAPWARREYARIEAP
jgi:4-amino-4-deoxy-L-arabinose transferase-like glycosyltransferase